MILPKEVLYPLLGISPQQQSAEALKLQFCHKLAESKVIDHIGYDPSQRKHREFHPRCFQQGGTGQHVSPTPGYLGGSTTCIIEKECCEIGFDQIIEVKNLPLRLVEGITVNGNSFGSYTVDWCKESFSKTGYIISKSCWPCERNSIEVFYTSGYSLAELLNDASKKVADRDADNGIITCEGVQAAGITEAILILFAHCRSVFANYQESDCGAAIGGSALQSESFDGGGGYSRAEIQMKALAFQVGMPVQAECALEKFVNYSVC